MHAIFHWCAHFGIVRDLTALIEPEYLVSTDLANLCDNTPPLGVLGETAGVSNAASRRKNGGVGNVNGVNFTDEHFSHQPLIGFFGHQLRMKIKTGRKRLLWADFSER